MIEQTVAIECEAYLHGTFAELRRACGAVPTAWMVLNLPAHGTREELVACQAEALPDATRWQRARSFLCGEVLDIVDGGTMTLAEIQTRVLVPLELVVCNERLQFSTTLSGVVSSASDVLGMCRRRLPGREERQS